MLSKTCNDRYFDDAIKQVGHTVELDLVNNNCLKIYRFPIINNEFNYTNLIGLLQDNIKSYVFSRKKINDAIETEKGERLLFEALTKFREIKNNGDKGKGAELGEILLYIFLESKLNAKKVLSKMELKTSQNDYVKGADGVFVYSYTNDENNYFDFIIGEAKLQDEIDDAITNTFKSIEDHLKSVDFEYNLVEDNIFKELVDEEEAEELKRIILPGFADGDKTYRNNAFGIFIGYTLGEDLNKKTATEAERIVIEKITRDIEYIKEKINAKIEQKNLQNYSFYVYILPFNKVSQDREKIMKGLLGT